MTTTTAARPLDLTNLFGGLPIPSPQTLREVAAVLLKLGESQEGPKVVEAPPAEGQFTVSCDGSALDNPGPGGWAYLIRFPCGREETNAGGFEHTTNNIAELTAATNALNALPVDAVGVLRSDSTYVVGGVTKWRQGWEKRGWRKADGSPVLNIPEWKALFRAVDAHPGMKLEWVRGHNGDGDNETVDLLARTEAEIIQQRQYTEGRQRTA